MKGILRYLSFVLVLCLAVALFSCTETENTVQSGIEIEESQAPEYSEKTRDRAREVIFFLMKRYLEKTTVSTLPQGMVNTLYTHADNLYVEMSKQSLSENSFLTVLDLLEKSGADVIDGVTSGEYKGALELYNELSSVVSWDYVGKTLYRFLIYAYEYRYEEYMEDYKQYGYEFLLIDAQKMENDRKILENEVGMESFSSAVRALYFATALARGGVQDGQWLEDFSDEEILLLVRHISFSLEGVSPQGYELLLSYIPASSEGTYVSKIMASSKENGDLKEISSVLGDTLSFLAMCRDSLDEGDVEHIRRMDMTALLESALSRLDDDGWEKFEKITSVAINTQDYVALAREHYGQSFLDYEASLTVSTVEELKQSVGTEDFLKTLEGYIAGICPALSYLVNYD